MWACFALASVAVSTLYVLMVSQARLVAIFVGYVKSFDKIPFCWEVAEGIFMADVFLEEFHGCFYFVCWF